MCTPDRNEYILPGTSVNTCAPRSLCHSVHLSFFLSSLTGKSYDTLSLSSSSSACLLPPSLALAAAPARLSAALGGIAAYLTFSLG